MMTHRGRAWRRLQRRKHGTRTQSTEPRACWQEKQWRLLYFRSAKLKRAKQLGRFWPHREWETILADAEPTNVLFVCSKNKWRSPTAEQVFRKVPDLQVRSAGTSRTARRPITVADIRAASALVPKDTFEQLVVNALHDRPFGFLVRDPTSGLVVFAGTLSQPRPETARADHDLDTERPS